jgi:hypothetical protein
MLPTMLRAGVFKAHESLGMVIIYNPVMAMSQCPVIASAPEAYRGVYHGLVVNADDRAQSHLVMHIEAHSVTPHLTKHFDVAIPGVTIAARDGAAYNVPGDITYALGGTDYQYTISFRCSRKRLGRSLRIKSLLPSRRR